MPRGTDGTSEPRDKRVSVRVTESRQAQWRDYADEYADGNLAQLLRDAVEEYVSPDGNAAQSPTVDSEQLGSVAEQLESVAEQLEQLDGVSGRLTSIENRLHAVESHVEPSESVEASDVVKALPPVQPHTEKWLVTQSQYEGGGTVVWSGRAEDLAEQFGVGTERIREALGRVESTPIEIESAVVGNNVHYWAPNQSCATDAVPSREELYEYGRAENGGDSE